ncbi:MAG: OprO/OprP family phosphate-selective porin [Puniceicoccales bacterium]|jgi:hypothetical protein|nr:OprO/OprP family phosphate-selective porin [Puniceicoccales bacterium]
MKKLNYTRFWLLAAGALLCAGSANAQTADKATLDLLVKKGLVSRTEADAVFRQNQASGASAAVVTSATGAAKITLGGYVQAGYTWARYTPKGGSSATNDNGFDLNRAVLEITARLNDNWSAFVNPEFDNTRSGDHHNYLDAAGITWDSKEFGAATAGLKKTNFGVEENTHPTQLKAITSSVLTGYFVDGLGFASRHVGLFWDGFLSDVDGVSYGFAVTNAKQDQFKAFGDNNKISFWANAAYTTGSFTTAKSKTPRSFTLGANLGWQRDSAGFVGTPEIFGYNPYVKGTLGNFTLVAEMLGAYVAQDNASRALPYGFNGTASYRINDIEPLVRFSYVDTDGTYGLSTDQNALANLPGPGANEGFDKAVSVFAGANFYLSSFVTFGAGYEYTRFRDGDGATKKADAHAIRAQLQAVF